MPTLPEIRFASIRAHLGSQTKGFEELVVQIFKLDTQHQGEFRRVEGAGGDGGVEAYLVRPDGSKIGVQSKFFVEVKAGQWKQIDKSVHAAIKNHPQLTEYGLLCRSTLTLIRPRLGRRELPHGIAMPPNVDFLGQFILFGRDHLR